MAQGQGWATKAAAAGAASSSCRHSSRSLTWMLPLQQLLRPLRQLMQAGCAAVRCSAAPLSAPANCRQHLRIVRTAAAAAGALTLAMMMSLQVATAAGAAEVYQQQAAREAMTAAAGVAAGAAAGADAQATAAGAAAGAPHASVCMRGIMGCARQASLQMMMSPVQHGRGVVVLSLMSPTTWPLGQGLGCMPRP